MWDKLDKQKADDIRARCKNVKPRKNMIVMRAIDSMVAQGQGGVGQYECSVSDPIFEKTPELVDALEATAMDFYRRNHIDSLLSGWLIWRSVLIPRLQERPSAFLWQD